MAVYTNSSETVMDSFSFNRSFTPTPEVPSGIGDRNTATMTGRLVKIQSVENFFNAVL